MRIKKDSYYLKFNSWVEKIILSPEKNLNKIFIIIIIDIYWFSLFSYSFFETDFSLYNSHRHPGTHYVGQVDLKLTCLCFLSAWIKKVYATTHGLLWIFSSSIKQKLC